MVAIGEHQIQLAAMRTQVLHAELAPEPMQRMAGMRHGNEAHRHERIAEEALRDARGEVKPGEAVP